MDSEKKQSTFVLIGLGVLILALGAYLAAYRRGSSETYHNQAYGITVRYDKELFVLGIDNESVPWRLNSTFDGERLLTLILPASAYEGTNFSQGLVMLGVSADAVDECLVVDNAETEQNTQIINGVSFSVFTFLDSGAGNFYETTSYRTIHDGTCVAIEKIIHYTHLGAYDPAQGIAAFDRRAVDEALSRVVKSIHLR